MAFAFDVIHDDTCPTQKFRIVKSDGSHLFLYLDTLANLTVNVRIDMSGVLFNFDQKSAINFSHSGLTFFRSNKGGSVTVSSDTMSLCCVTGTAINISSCSTGCYRDWETDRKSTRLNSSHSAKSRMPSSA